ncbi:glycosyltransferase [uncultured Helicobacter sp.]|uniref:glycosyltransferase n=1 Tax=uncultured Helicobacter sp. TaxID=175537 RepID=UPI00260FC553|nr:glycosyltransferase [uncultured Helicobacter sp.]
MFHIVFSADENYIPYTAVLIASIVQNTDTSKGFERLCQSSNMGDNSAIRNLKAESLNERQEGYIFHILSNSVNEQTREKLERLEKSLTEIYPCTIQVHIMQECDFKRFPKCGAAHSNYLPYYRLKMDTFLNREVEKFLYLMNTSVAIPIMRCLYGCTAYHRKAFSLKQSIIKHISNILLESLWVTFGLRIASDVALAMTG